MEAREDLLLPTRDPGNLDSKASRWRAEERIARERRWESESGNLNLRSSNPLAHLPRDSFIDEIGIQRECA
jgi:hypothetical protein